jgi:hypothetical protein
MVVWDVEVCIYMVGSLLLAFQLPIHHDLGFSGKENLGMLPGSAEAAQMLYN